MCNFGAEEGTQKACGFWHLVFQLTQGNDRALLPELHGDQSSQGCLSSEAVAEGPAGLTSVNCPPAMSTEP